MSNKAGMGYVYIFFTIILTVYGQLAVKWGLARYGVLPEPLLEKFFFLFKAIFSPIIFSGFVAAFMGSLCWMTVLSKFEISYAYPFMSFAFILVTVSSYFLFNESLSVYKVLGLLIIIVGIVVASKG